MCRPGASASPLPEALQLALELARQPKEFLQRRHGRRLLDEQKISGTRVQYNAKKLPWKRRPLRAETSARLPFYSPGCALLGGFRRARRSTAEVVMARGEQGTLPTKGERPVTTSELISIREATEQDREAVWEIFHAVVAGGDTYVFEPETPREEAFDYWFHRGTRTYVAEGVGRVVGTYILRPNRPGLGSHVSNAAFMVSPSARGLGVGRAMGEHCLKEARRLGYRAMQFNFVVSTNEAAVSLWRRLRLHHSRHTARRLPPSDARLRRRLRHVPLAPRFAGCRTHGPARRGLRPRRIDPSFGPRNAGRRGRGDSNP